MLMIVLNKRSLQSYMPPEQDLKTAQFEWLNGFIKTAANQNLINATSSQPLSTKKKFKLQRLL